MFSDISNTQKWLITAGAGATAVLLLRRIVFGTTAFCMNRVMLTGKAVIITGGNTGLGKATAVELARRGARVILGCRDMGKGVQAAVDVRRVSKNSNVEVKPLDLASLSSVRQFSQAILEQEEKLDILINNAGVFKCPFSTTEDGFETQFGVNYLGHVLLTNMLLPKLEHSSPSRIIMVSSAYYKKGHIDFENLNSASGYDKSLAYSNSKLAGLLFMNELSKRLPEGVTVNALHPGVVRTELGRHLVTGFFAKLLFPLFAFLFFKSPIEGIQTIVHLATDPSVEKVSGKYFGNCKEEELTPNAVDNEVAKRLWDVSQKMIKNSK